MVSLFWSSQTEVSGENGISWKVVQNSQTEFPSGERVYRLHSPMILLPSDSLVNLERIL